MPGTKSSGDAIAMICLEGSTPVAMHKVQVLWRSAFQAHRPRIAYPRTSSPVTVAALRSAFQALSILIQK